MLLDGITLAAANQMVSPIAVGWPRFWGHAASGMLILSNCQVTLPSRRVMILNPVFYANRLLLLVVCRGNCEFHFR